MHRNWVPVGHYWFIMGKMQYFDHHSGPNCVPHAISLLNVFFLEPLQTLKKSRKREKIWCDFIDMVLPENLTKCPESSMVPGVTFDFSIDFNDFFTKRRYFKNTYFNAWTAWNSLFVPELWAKYWFFVFFSGTHFVRDPRLGFLDSQSLITQKMVAGPGPETSSLRR